MFCEKCGKEIMDEAFVCPHCGCATSNYKQPISAQYVQTPTAPVVSNEPANVGLNILSFLIPLVGFIMAAVYWNSKPNVAKGCLKWAIVSVGIYIVIACIPAIVYILDGMF